MEGRDLTKDDFVDAFWSRLGSPVVLTVPHNGFKVEKIKEPWAGRVHGTHLADARTWRIAREVLMRCQAHAVRGLLPRKWLDYNRCATEAFEHPRFENSYHAYHEQVARLLSDSIEWFGCKKALLLDIHGFASQPDYAPAGGFDIILGTGNRSTVKTEVDRELAHFLRTRGYSVFLPVRESVRPLQIDYLNGQHTVRHHAATLGVNAIQVEIGSKFRLRLTDEPSLKIAHDLALFISGYESSL